MTTPRTIILSVILSTLSFLSLNAATNPAIAGDSAYNNRDYNTALQQYTQALNQYGPSTDLYYNIGNTQYRLGSLSQAIIAYERALKIDPSNTKAQTNLDFLKTKTIDRPEDDTSYLTTLHHKTIALCSPDTWAYITLALFITLLTLIALYTLTQRPLTRKIGFFGAIITLPILIYTTTIAITTITDRDTHDTAIITATITNLTSSPSQPQNKTDKTLPLHEGTKLTIIDSLQTPKDPTTTIYYNVKINNTTTAWVSGADIEKI